MYKLLLTLSVVLTIIVISIFAVEDLQKKNELGDMFGDKLKRIMAGVDEHCEAVQSAGDNRRKKREATNSILRLLHGALEDCLDNKDDEITTPHTAISHGPCTSPDTANLTGDWRRDLVGSDLRPADGSYACDKELQGNSFWFRFTGTGGSMLSNKCAPAYSCGAHGSFWSDATMPTSVGEVRQVPIYGSWNGNCDWYTWPVANPLTVLRCSSTPGDLVYRVRGTKSCYWTFCGMDYS